MGFRMDSHGDWRETEAYLQRMKVLDLTPLLHKYGAMGVSALASATPVDSGLSAQSWYYEIVNHRGYHAIRWFNSHKEDDGTGLVVILLQYGHATGTGGYVQGQDFINPAIRPIFDQIEAEVRKAVTT